ncbi:MAG TPA: phosphopantothenoylcysteine decarboxylase, partial [Hanamia sp.]|nr:phosphopantothenoylcysteine decarboxylase [Hanamia sp.]
MYGACMKNFEAYDIIIMASAVADYTPVAKASQKIKKKENEFSLSLIKTKDILSEAGKIKSDSQILVGFALETENEKANALEKLAKKNADFIVMNSLNNEATGFGYATNKISIFGRDGKEYDFPLKPKKEVAVDIVNLVTQNNNE